MSYFVDISIDSINKYGEELCGDKVEVVKLSDSIIIVVSDGLGSGVKANILAGLTSKIAATMLREGASIYETVDTIVNTLPTCKIRKLAYSTFTIIKVYFDGRVYIAEYDNPPFLLFKKNSSFSIQSTKKLINGKSIKESKFFLEDEDVLTVVTDGVIHAGVGGILNLGWQWGNVYSHLNSFALSEKCAKNISKNLIEACQSLYCNVPGDDATAVVIKLKKPQIVNIFTGPPEKKENDHYLIKRFMSSEGKKVVCGGTAANIASRELGERLSVSMEFIDPEVPPIAYLKGVDLVTEGVLTLSKSIDIIKRYTGCLSIDDKPVNLRGRDGASRLASLLIEDCSHINLFVGRAINPAHQNPDFPIDLSIKLNLIEELVGLMRSLGKIINLSYV